jgi:hypothetical protein
MDGPGHLYNSNLLIELLKNNSSELHNYFNINNFPVANWMSMFILALFNSFLPAWMAEKIFILLYLIGICLSFRFLIMQTNPENSGLSFLIFPFAYSFLFHLGFYNYSVSFIFLFLIIGYWIKYKNSRRLGLYLFMFLLFFLLYFSAILSFLFAGLTIGLITIAHSFSGYKKNQSFSAEFKKLIVELLILLLLTLPFLFFTVWFYHSTNFFPSGNQYSVNELVKWLNDVRCLIVYDYVGDEKLTQQILHILIAILAIAVYRRFVKDGNPKFKFMDILLLPIILIAGLYFIMPDGSAAGMMSDRYCLLLYIFLISWVASQELPKKTTSVFIILIIGFHLGLLLKHHNGVIRDLDRHAQSITYASQYINKNSIVLPVNLSDNWIEPHFSNYLGIEKPMTILENYQASIGWFPLQWNMREIPEIKLGNYNDINGLFWPTKVNSVKSKQIDYVVLYGNTDKIKDPDWSELNNQLAQFFQLNYTSPDNYVKLFQRISKLE